MRIAISLICVFLAVQTFGQDRNPIAFDDRPYKSLSVSMGINSFHSLDEYLSPHTFSRNMFSTLLAYNCQGKLVLHSVEAGFSTGHPNSAVQARNVTENMLSVSYRLLRLIAEKPIAGKILRMSAGAGLSSFLANTDFIATDSQHNYEWSEQSWYCSNSLDFCAEGKYRLSQKSTVSAQLTIPVFLFVSRPESGHLFSQKNQQVINNFINAMFQGCPEFFWKNPVFSCNLGFAHQLGSRTNLTLNYLFNYVSSNRPEALHVYTNRFLVGFEFLF